MLSDHPEGILATDVTVRRISDEPVIEYGSVAGYGPIFNAGAVFHDGRFHLFARGVRDCYRRNEGPGPRFVDYVSDILVFVSDDGRSYEYQQTLAEASSGDVWCFEDPRVQTVRSNGREHFVMTYTNLPPHDHGLPWTRLDAFGLEYRYVGRFLQGQMPRADMVRQLKSAIHDFAKRQMTWWKRDKDIRWVTKSTESEHLVKSFLIRH